MAGAARRDPAPSDACELLVRGAGGGDDARALRRRADGFNALARFSDGPGGERRFRGRLQPPQQRYGDLREIEFGLRELEPAP